MSTRWCRSRVSNPITCWSVTHWGWTPPGMLCPQRTKSLSSVRVLERGIVCSLRDIATIDAHGMSGDKRGSIGAKPHDGFGNFFGGANPSDRMPRTDLGLTLRIAQASCRHRGLNIAWTDTIHPNTL